MEGESFRSIGFDVRTITFDGLKGLPASALAPAYAEYVGTRQPVSVICEIRDRAATILRNAGYIAAVEIPEQRIADGNVRFQVLMARLVGVRVRGDAGRAERVIAGYLERLTQDDVFNRFAAERYLLLAGDVPGLDVRLALRSAGAAPGEVIGEVAVLRTPGQIDFNVQNFGSSDLGRFGGLLRGQFYGLTGLGDRTTLSFFSTADFDEQQTVQLGHDFRLGDDGLALSGLFTYAWAEPSLKDFKVNSETLLATFDASYPLIRRQDRTLRATLGFDLVNQDVRLNDKIDISRDRLRVLFGRVDFEAVDAPSLTRRSGYSAAEPRWRFAGGAELRQGLDIFGASDSCFERDCSKSVAPSRLEGDPTGTVLRLDSYAEYRPSPKLTFSLGGRAQWSNDALLSFEEFSAGNYTVGRGYDPGALLGDRGIGVQAEVRFGTILPRDAESLSLQPYLFADAAWIGNEDQAAAKDVRQSLTSVGGGVRGLYGDKLQIDVAFAVPLERVGSVDERRPDPRVLVSLTTRLWPWSY